MLCDLCQDFIGGEVGEVVGINFDVLKTSLLGDKLHEKVYIMLSFCLSLRVCKPRLVASKIEFCDGFYVCTEKRFENDLTYVLISSIFIIAKAVHVQNFDRRAILHDLSEKTGNRSN